MGVSSVYLCQPDCVMCSCARPDNYVVPTEETHVQSDDQSGEKQLGDGK